MKKTLYELFKKYAVQADSVEDFCERYHKKEKYHDRGKEYVECDLQSHVEEFRRDGYTIIPKGTSKTGDVVAFYGKNKAREGDTDHV